MPNWTDGAVDMQRAVADDWVVWGRSHHGMLVGALALVYFLAGKLGLHFAFVHASATAIWPPTGIALAAVLLFGRRVWPAVFVGAFLVNVSIAGSIASSLGVAAGNTLEALTGAFLVERYAAGARAFDRARTILRFMVLAGVVSTAVSATIGAASLRMTVCDCRRVSIHRLLARLRRAFARGGNSCARRAHYQRVVVAERDELIAEADHLARP